MLNKKLSFTLILAMVISLLAGCQTVGLVDLSKVMYNPTIVSYEGNGSVTLTLGISSPTKLTREQAEELKMMRLFKNMKFTMSSIKVEDKDTMSMKGSIEVSKGAVPFHVSMDKQQMVMQLEGADEPIVFRSFGMNGAGDETTGLNEEATEKLLDTYQQIQDVVATYIVKNLPNPKTIEITDETVSINGVSQELKHVNATIKGNELGDYALEFLANVIEDEQGLRDMIDQLFDLVLPIYLAEVSDDAEQDAQSIEDEILSSKKETVDMLIEGLTNAHTELEKSLADNPKMIEEATGLDENSTLKVDLYVNDKFQTLKSKFDLFLKPNVEALTAAAIGVSEEEQAQGPSVESIRVQIEQEMWNINETVKADLIVPGKNAMIFDEDMSARGFVRSMDPTSVAYRVLRHEMYAARQTVTMDVDPTINQPEKSMSPYIVKGVSMVPLRSVADGFDASVKYQKKTKSVELYDEGQKIVLPLDSKTAYLNGKKKFLGLKIINRAGVTYVPAKATFQMVGANVSYDKETSEITIERD